MRAFGAEWGTPRYEKLLLQPRREKKGRKESAGENSCVDATNEVEEVLEGRRDRARSGKT